MDISRFVISPAWLGGLSSLIPGEKSPLFPLRIPNPPPLTPEQQSEMEQNDLLDAGNLTEPARSLLVSLSEAQSFGRVRLSAPNGMLDEAFYFNGEEQSVGISNTGSGLILAAPGVPDKVFSQIVEFTGSSTHPVANWSITLPPLEMVALTALLDLRRKAVLRAMPENQALLPPPSDPVSLAAAIQSMWNNPQWFTAAIQTVSGLPSAPPAPQIQAALNTLVQKNFVWTENGAYIPTTEAIQVTDRFLLVNTILTLDAGSSNAQDRVALVRQVWLQSLISEMLHVSLNENQLTLRLVNPASALEKIHSFLTQFDALPAPPLEVVPLALMIVSGAGAGQVFDMGDETVLGRSDQAQIHILDARASRRHTVIRKLVQGYQINDAGSTNGTYLNGQLISSPTWINEGDEITIGDTHLKVIRPGTATAVVVESDSTVFASSSLSPDRNEALPGEPASPMAARAPEAAAPVETHESFPAAENVQPIPQVAESELEPVPPVEPTPVDPSTCPEHVAAMMPLVIPPAPVIPVAPVPSQAPSDATAAPTALPQTTGLTQNAASQPSVCGRCHEPLLPGDQVCRNCGQPVDQPISDVLQPETPLAPLCPNCGSPIIPGARFCGACGNRLIT